MMQTPTPHIAAKLGDFAKTVLMPGDPKRAKFIADHFLTDVVLVNDVRNMLGFTGFYKGKRVSVMGSGMGMPSIGIYSYELFAGYQVDTIIRIGTAGAYQKDLNLHDLVFAQTASTNSQWASQFSLQGGTFSPPGDFDLLTSGVQVAKQRAIPFKVGNILSSDIFYDASPEQWKKWEALGVLAVEMETYALYTNALRLGKKALAMMMISDSFHFHTILTPEQRETSLKAMIEVALEIAP
jgi:purine-nucleoside phosphorylase